MMTPKGTTTRFYARFSVGLSAAVFVIALVLAAAPARAADNLFRVTLLGTGTPVPSPVRFGSSTLVEAGSQKLLFDFGRGVTIRLAQLKIPFGAINAHFLTHFHSDHINGLPDLWLTGWLRPPYGQRNHPMTIFGPPGLVKLTRGLTEAFTRDIEIRREDEKDPEAGIAFDVHEKPPGPMYEADGVKVSSFLNDHGPLVTPSYGYKIEYAGHTVVLSGDTRYSAEVVRQAKGADVLVHCVTVIPDELLQKNPAYKAIYLHLASPEAAGRVFAEARPKLAVYSHIGLNGGATEAVLIASTRTAYDGPLQVGRDLMAINVGDNPAVVDSPDMNKDKK
ncbi:MBL fold metallo-hydrolase [Pseudolabrys sp. FHR47]|uniref:MBL fold metallo-hydrolase n=1 Tax=Pseudolabrys sp. FHR47 TaxID=2562284 RepID=UPI0010BF101D|nr:MBL fold metallo-hydrolase [Pseudolabrys sp. FHR47]